MPAAEYRARDRTLHPPAYTPDYKTSVLRSPRRPPLSAGALLQGWEGALMRARVSRDLTPLRNFVDLEFSRLLDSY